VGLKGREAKPVETVAGGAARNETEDRAEMMCLDQLLCATAGEG
jgi:hypothetical protein